MRLGGGTSAAKSALPSSETIRRCGGASEGKADPDPWGALPIVQVHALEIWKKEADPPGKPAAWRRDLGLVGRHGALCAPFPIKTIITQCMPWLHDCPFQPGQQQQQHNASCRSSDRHYCTTTVPLYYSAVA